MAWILMLAFAACAAERLEARDPARGPASATNATTPVVRPTVLQATEKLLAPQAQPPPAAKARYVCPMHAEVQSSAPGDCPKCGMKLERKESAP